jgi:hypothetical protein
VSISQGTKHGDTKVFVLKRPARKGGEEEFTVKIYAQEHFSVTSAIEAFFKSPGAPIPADALNAMDAVRFHFIIFTFF